MTHDIFISDFNDERFQTAFKQYFAELGHHLSNWEPLFHEMNHDGSGTHAYVRVTEENRVAGFIMFCCMDLSSWFFDTQLGFIREFWVSAEQRGHGHGSELLKLAEDWFRSQGVYKSILTTHTAESFYLRHGYHKDRDIHARNNDSVYIKILR